MRQLGRWRWKNATSAVWRRACSADSIWDKALIVVAAQEDGPGIGRIRMRQIVDASAASLMPFVQESVEPGSVIHTDGWLGYLPVESKG
jgi:hypothetical protein